MLCNSYISIVSLNVQHADYTLPLLLFAVNGTIRFRFFMHKISYSQPLVLAFCMKYELQFFLSNIAVQLPRHCWLYHQYRKIVFSQPRNYSAINKAQQLGITSTLWHKFNSCVSRPVNASTQFNYDGPLYVGSMTVWESNICTEILL